MLIALFVLFFVLMFIFGNAISEYHDALLSFLAEMGFFFSAIGAVIVFVLFIVQVAGGLK